MNPFRLLAAARGPGRRNLTIRCRAAAERDSSANVERAQARACLPILANASCAGR